MANFLETATESLLCGDAPFPETDCARLYLEQPESIREWHHRFAEAGARILCTQTAATHRVALHTFGLDSHTNELNWKAAKLASGEAGDGVWVAGTVGSLPDSTPPSEVASVYRQQIGALLDGGSDLILFREISQWTHLEIGLEMLRNLHHCPALCLSPRAPDPGSARNEAIRWIDNGGEGWGWTLDADSWLPFFNDWKDGLIVLEHDYATGLAKHRARTHTVILGRMGGTPKDLARALSTKNSPDL
jgi:hypothetical protein